MLHPILVRALAGPARLRRFPLAFLEAFPGLLLLSSPTAAAAAAGGHANGRHAEGQEEDVVKADGGGGVLAPGLWRRAVAAVLCPPAAGGGVNSGGSGGDGAAVVSARLKLVCFGDRGDGVQQGQQRKGSSKEKGRKYTAAEMRNEIRSATVVLAYACPSHVIACVCLWIAPA